MQTDEIRTLSHALLTKLSDGVEKNTLRLDVQTSMAQATAAIGIVTFLAEIAAQLAELNEQLKPQKVSVELRNIPIAEL